MQAIRGGGTGFAISTSGARLLAAVAIIVVAGLLALPSLASANTTISYSSTQNKLLVSTDGGESNFISASQTGNTYTFSEDGFNDTTFSSLDLIETASQCTRLTSPTLHVDCTVANLSFIDVNLGTGDFDGFDASDLASVISHPVATDLVIDAGNGDDYVLGGTGNDTLTGSYGDDDLEGDLGNDTIDAGDDDDSYIDGGPGDDTIDAGNGDDFLAGGEGNDVLQGANGDDSYEGDDGDDTFVAEPDSDGADSIDDFGDIGTDTADYSARLAAQSLSNNDDFDDGAVALSGEDGLGNRDEIASDIEVMLGGKGADTLKGVGLLGNSPNVLRGNLGNDTLIGTDGVVADTADYSNAPLAVTVDLAAGTATGGANSDTLTAIENAYGSASGDTLAGSGSDNLLRGNAGNDSLTGAGGSDTADYANAASAVTMNLAAANPHNTVAAGSDTLSSVEGVNGGSANDTLTGDPGANTLKGNAGNDTLTGAAGHDAVAGGDGNDTLQTFDTEDDGPLTCDAGTDSVIADPLPLDATGADCESVDRSAGLPPAPPTLTATSPASPSSNSSPKVIGSADSGVASVSIYTNATCTGTPAVTSTNVAAFSSTGLTVSPLPSDGSYTFHATATNASGTSACSTGASGSLTYVLDTTAPDTSITGGPANGSSTNDNTPTFSFTSPDATATFECRVDAGSFAACGSAFTTVALGDGAHTFDVRAKDPAGNIDASPASRSFTVDTVVPDTSITAGPANGSSTNDNTPTFSFTSPDATATFECSVDAGSFAACSSAFTTVALGDGAHTFDVRAKDPAGNIDASPASRSFTVDTTPPDTSITAGPAGGSTTTSNTPTFSFTSPDATATFECRVDAGAFASCTSPRTTAALSDGPHTFDVRAKDPVGNTDPSPASRSFTVDTTAPDTSITGGPANGSSTNDNTPTFSFTSPDATATFECRVDAGAYVPATSPFTAAALGDGSHTVDCRAKDPVGNIDPSPASRSFTVDTSVPDTSISAGPANGSTITDNTPTFSFTATEAGATFECRVDAAAFAACASAFTTATLPDGAHAFDVRSKDAAGNIDASPASRSFTVDATPPDTSITAGPAGGSTINYSTPTFGFTSTDLTATFECRADGGPFASCTSPFTTAALSDGPHTFDVRAKDPVGNVDASPASRGFTVLANIIDRKVFGSTISLLGNADPSKKKLNLKARDLLIGTGAGNGSIDDPTVQGATLRVVSSAGGGFDSSYSLPASNWGLVGAPGANKGYKYKDSKRLLGPVSSALLKAGGSGKAGQLSFVGAGSALGHTLAADPSTVSIAATLGAQRFCAQYGGIATFRVNSFKAKNAPAPASCPTP
jgi:Ca2+-binding RTX toxin-like protein